MCVAYMTICVLLLSNIFLLYSRTKLSYWFLNGLGNDNHDFHSSVFIYTHPHTHTHPTHQINKVVKHWPTKGLYECMTIISSNIPRILCQLLGHTTSSRTRLVATSPIPGRALGKAIGCNVTLDLHMIGAVQNLCMLLLPT